VNADADFYRNRLAPVAVLMRMDANRDGMLEPEEIPEGAEPFVSHVAGEAGVDSGNTLDLDHLGQTMRQIAEESFKRLKMISAGERAGADAASDSQGELTTQTLIRWFDLNRDGVVDVRESGALSEKQRAALAEETANRLLEGLAVCRHMDADRDGLLHPDEVPDPLKPYVGRIGQKAGAEAFTKPWRLYGLERRLLHLSYQSKNVSRRGAAGHTERASRAFQENAAASEVEKQYVERNTARTYARNLLQLYDKNNDAVLEEREWKRLSDAWRKTDRNRDGKLTSEEIADKFVWYRQVAARSSANVASHTSSRDQAAGIQGPTYTVTNTVDMASRVGASPEAARPAATDHTGLERKPSRYWFNVRRLPEGLPVWFLQRDADGDGQVQMSEFAETWTEATVAEFQRHDLNRDGVITPKEYLTAAE
jgi:Ca2+-binding EF-hand superfamily protein